MPLKIIKRDITKMKCDAIVNPTNSYMQPDGGVDVAIHSAAGEQLTEYCRTLGRISVGEAKISPAFGLPCKYVIHTVGPKWGGGLLGERVLLQSCYKEAMTLALQNKCRSIAFPLISSGLYGYPKDKVLREATDVLNKILEDCEIDVFIVVYDKSDYSVSQRLLEDVGSFVDDFYHGSLKSSLFVSIEREANERNENRIISDFPKVKRGKDGAFSPSPVLSVRTNDSEKGAFSSKRLDKMLSEMDKGFAETLFSYIDKKGVSDVEAYKRSNVSRKTFSKIKCDKQYKPSKITAVSFAIGLHLTLDETKHLLSTAGIALSRAKKFDVIIEYFLTSGKYENIHDVNAVLYQFDQMLLGV